jgi:hypothetical protein
MKMFIVAMLMLMGAGIVVLAMNMPLAPVPGTYHQERTLKQKCDHTDDYQWDSPAEKDAYKNMCAYLIYEGAIK